MEDYRAMFNKIREEHLALRGNIRLVGDSVSDQEALNALRKARAEWIPGRPEILAEKQKRLQQTLSLLEEGLRNHFTVEEKVLPPLFGELLMRAIILRHEEISRGIDEAKSVAAGMKLEGLSREELLSKESHMQGVIDTISRLVEEHANEEEIILEMLERALKEK